MRKIRKKKAEGERGERGMKMVARGFDNDSRVITAWKTLQPVSLGCRARYMHIASDKKLVKPGGKIA
jgi:hypothetical protein